MLERFVRLEGVPSVAVDQQIAKWLQQVSQFVSPEQIKRLMELKDHHMRERELMMAERAQINKEIKVWWYSTLMQSLYIHCMLCRNFTKKRWLASD